MKFFNKNKKNNNSNNKKEEQLEQEELSFKGKINKDGSYNPSDVQTKYMVSEIKTFIFKYKLQFGKAFIEQDDKTGTLSFLADSPNHFTIIVDLSNLEFTEEQMQSKNPLTEKMIMDNFRMLVDNIKISEKELKENYDMLIKKAKTLDPLRHNKDLVPFDVFVKNVESDIKYFRKICNLD